MHGQQNIKLTAILAQPATFLTTYFVIWPT